jgi:hypothetical protein
MNGRRYFAEAARRLHIDRLDPDEIAELPPLDVKRGPAESKLGGRIAHNLKRLSPEETAARRESSEELLGEAATDKLDAR